MIPLGIIRTNSTDNSVSPPQIQKNQDNYQSLTLRSGHAQFETDAS